MVTGVPPASHLDPCRAAPGAIRLAADPAPALASVARDRPPAPLPAPHRHLRSVSRQHFGAAVCGCGVDDGRRGL